MAACLVAIAIVGIVIAADGGARPKQVIEHSSYVQCLAVSPNGQLIAAGDSQGGIALWSTETWERLSYYGRHHGDAPISCLTFSPDGTFLATGGWDNRVHLLDVRSGKIATQFTKHRSWVHAVEFSPDGKKVVSVGGAGYQDGQVFVWDVATGGVALSLSDFRNRVVSATFSPDGEFLFTKTEYGPVQQWGATSGKLVRELPVSSFGNSVLRFSPTQTQLVGGDAQISAMGESKPMVHTLVILEYPSFQQVAVIRPSGNPAVFSPDGKLLAVCSGQERSLRGQLMSALHGQCILKICDVRTGETSWRATQDPYISDVGFVDAERLVVTSGGVPGSGGVIRIYSQSDLVKRH